MAESAPVPGSPLAIPASTHDLLAMHDVAFVQAAYRVLLGREADDSGLAAFVKQVRHGDDKALVVMRLAQSDEGRQRRVSLDGLEELLRTHAPQQRSWPVRALRRLSHTFVRPAQEPLERTLRVLDNRLYRIELALEHQSGKLHHLREASSQMAVSLAMLKGRNAGGATDDAATSTVAPAALPRQVPPRLEQVMRGLQRAISRRRNAP